MFSFLREMGCMMQLSQPFFPKLALQSFPSFLAMINSLATVLKGDRKNLKKKISQGRPGITKTLSTLLYFKTKFLSSSYIFRNNQSLGPSPSHFVWGWGCRVFGVFKDYDKLAKVCSYIFARLCEISICFVPDLIHEYDRKGSNHYSH